MELLTSEQITKDKEYLQEMMKKWSEHIKTGKQNDGDNTSTD